MRTSYALNSSSISLEFSISLIKPKGNLPIRIQGQNLSPSLSARLSINFSLIFNLFLNLLLYDGKPLKKWLSGRIFFWSLVPVPNVDIERVLLAELSCSRECATETHPNNPMRVAMTIFRVVTFVVNFASLWPGMVFLFSR